MNLKEEFYSKLKNNKIKINWNKSPIEVKLFLSFLKIDVVKIDNHPGCYTGWTQYVNNEYKLIIGGGLVNNVEYLDTLQFGENLGNIYNNYVNPFYLLNILSVDGKKFFANYYKNEIEDILKSSCNKIVILTEQLREAKELKIKISEEIKTLF